MNLTRWKKIDAEAGLRETNWKFKRRFAYVEQGAKKQGKSLSDMTLEEMDIVGGSKGSRDFLTTRRRGSPEGTNTLRESKEIGKSWPG